MCLLLAAAAAGAQTAGEVEFSRGVGFAQTPGQAPRTLGKGLPLKEGDRLTTAEGASAIIKLEDGTRMTVRPNSEIVLQQYQFKENAPDNGMLMQLVRGGFRAVTGLISKNAPNAARIQTNTATIGIRGTDFDARLCTRDCGAESARVAAVGAAQRGAGQRQGRLGARRGATPSTARGSAAAWWTAAASIRATWSRPAAAPRPCWRSATTRASRWARRTRFRVDNFVYDDKNAGEGRFLVSLLKGSVRALTGLIAKANNRNVGFSTATATIGIRGTGLDINCTGACAGEAGDAGSGLTLFTWLGSIVVTPSGQTALQALQAGQGLFISPSGHPGDRQPSRPWKARVPTPCRCRPSCFPATTCRTPRKACSSSCATATSKSRRPATCCTWARAKPACGHERRHQAAEHIPKFIDFDRLPLPTATNPLLVSVLSESGSGRQPMQVAAPNDKT